MFRSPQPGDWAAEDDDDLDIPMPSNSSTSSASASASGSSAPRGADVFVPPPKPKQVKSAWGDPNKSAASAKTTSASLEPTPAEAAAAPAQKAPPRRDEDAGSSPFFRDSPNDRRDHSRERSGFDRSGSREENKGNRWGNRGDRQDRFDRNDRGYDRNERGSGRDNYNRGGGGSDRFERGSGPVPDRFDKGDRYDRRGPPSGRDSYDRFDRRGGNDRGGDRFDRHDRGSDRFDRGGPGPDRYERSERQRNTPPPIPVERGIVISIKDNFGFVSCADRDGDLFFHISEAPVDIQMKDEVEFKVKYNNRSQKDIAFELVLLPKGTIVFEDITEDFFEGVVSKGLPRSTGFDNSRDPNAHGLIEVKEAALETEKDKEVAETDENKASPLKRKEFIRFDMDSVASPEESEEEENKRPRKPKVPHFGDEVQFKIATHRKTGVKRAVELTIMLSFKEKQRQEVEKKLSELTREQGIIVQVKGGGGFIKCVEREEDIYFPFSEIEDQDDKSSKNGRGGGRGGRSIRDAIVREGDEVSFLAYEDIDTDGKSRLTAMRIQKLLRGTVSFEQVLRTNVEGVVTKVPRDPRHGAEVIGTITVESKEKKKTQEKRSFRLLDVFDISYTPHSGDRVLFDEVEDKRSKKKRTTNVRVIELHGKNRETGIITAMKEDFGFIKCAERPNDAFFRFQDVICGNDEVYSIGTEVSFDLQIDTAKENARASRIQILDKGSVVWEEILDDGAYFEGKIINGLPFTRRPSGGGGGFQKKDDFQQFQYGRIAVDMEKALIEYLPNLKSQIDQVFGATVEGEEQQEEEETQKKAKQLIFPSTLSKYERAAIHTYCDTLGLSHESSGEGKDRAIKVTSSTASNSSSNSNTDKEDKAPKKKLLKEKKIKQQQQQQQTQHEKIEFRREDVAEVRYEPRPGDIVQFQIVLLRRTKQFMAKNLTLVQSKAAIIAAAQAQASKVKEYQGYVVVMKRDGGFGFIEVAKSNREEEEQVQREEAEDMEENVFFHINEIDFGCNSQEILAVGTEVKFQIVVDPKKKKKKAIKISLLPRGTLAPFQQKLNKKQERFLVGIITRASLLQKFQKKFHHQKHNHHQKYPKAFSSLGKILVLHEDDKQSLQAQDQDQDQDQEEETEEGLEEEEKAENAAEDQAHAGRGILYTYLLEDVVDPSILLREGDEVSFSAKHKRKAGQINLIKSNAFQGTVLHVNQDFSGEIEVDGDEPKRKITFLSCHVLKGDILKTGDRVEFAISKQKQFAISILRIKTEEQSQSSPEKDQGKRGSRVVNSTLLLAMRQVGANAMVSSRMAKGPDGTKGFAAGWRSQDKEEEEEDDDDEEEENKEEA